MNTWTRTIIVGVALLTGCEGSIGGSKTSGTGSGSSTGTAGNTSVVTGTGGTNVVSTGTAGTTAVDPTVCTPGIPATSQLPRLTRAEYDRTILELLSLDVQPSSMLAPDTLGSVDQRAWDGYQAAADSLATQVMANPTAKMKVLGCTATGDGTACATSFISSFGRRAFRRPLTTAETARFQALYTNRMMITQNGTFDQAVQVILKAFLLSPTFLTKAEFSEATPEGSSYALNSWEMASRLSYTLWGTMPDDALFTAAMANQLTTPADILAQAQRMVMDPKARAKTAAFHMAYAHQGGGDDRWAQAAHDPALFSNFKVAMVPLLTEEAKRFFEYVTFDLKGSFQDLLTKPIAFVNKDLAPIYGLDPAAFGTDLKVTDLNGSQRAGVFTNAGFLASYSSYNRTSPILRGAFLERDILCRQMPPPDPNAFSTALPPASADLDTNRKQVTQQTSPANCVSCHGPVVNPPGFALEAFDSIGSWQTTEKGTGAMIDSTADVLIGDKTVHVTGPVDLMKAIASSPEGQGCYARQMVTFAYERALTSQDVCTAQMLAAKMGQSTPYSIVSMLTDLTQTQSFRYRVKELP
jgi:hypothetical protein